MVAEILQARAGPVRQQPSSRQSPVRLRLSPASTRSLAQGLRGAGDKRGSAPEDSAGKRAEASQTLMEMIVIGWVDDEGYIYIVERKKEMIKYKSFSIAPAELESVLLEHPDIADCGVTGAPDPDAGEAPKAFIVPRQGRKSGESGRFTFSEEVASRHPAHCTPRLFGYG